jgi:hypothetical protein
VLVGAPFETTGSSPAGAGRVYQFNGATGGRIRTFSAPVEQAHARFGWAVAAVPDANGDGRDDIAVSSPYFDPDPKTADAGHVYVFNGRTGVLMRVLTSPARETDGRFGHSLAGVPDTNGDSRGDVLVGAPFEDPGLSPENNGRAYIYSGASGMLLRKLFPPAQTAQGRFGISVGGTADLNNDGRGDAVIGAQGESVGLLPGAGRVHVFSGATGIRIKTIVSPNAESGAAFGAAAVGVPDANLNNRGDVAAGAPSEDPGASPSGAGRAYLFKF